MHKLSGRLEEEAPEREAADQARKFPMFEERLFKARTILIYGPIEQKVAALVTAQLLALQAAGDEPITVFINSPGGHVESGDTIYDMLKFVKPVVRMIGTGWVASAGSLIYSAARREHRYALPNTRFLLHQPSGGMGGTASDIAIHAREIVRMRGRLNEIYARETGQPIERIAQDTERDYWMSAQEAQDYGLVGRIISSADQVG
jgi:ATP-dependent Clp protease protease subunit